MRIRHHFPRPLGHRHPAWWTAVVLALAAFLLGAFAALLYLRPLTLIYGLSAMSGNRVAISRQPGPGKGAESRLFPTVDFPLGPGQKLHGQYQKWRWLSSSQIELTGVTVGDDPAHPFFYADAVRLGWSWRHVFRTHRLSNIDLDHPNLYLGKMLAAFPRAGEGQADPSEGSGGDPISVMRRIFYKFKIIEGTLWLDNLAPGMPTLPVSIGRGAPVEWTTGSPVRATDEEENIKFAEMNGIVLFAPPSSGYDNAPVLDLGKVRIGFKWEGLARQEIESLSFNGPTIHVGPPLFDFASAFKQAGTPDGSAAPIATATGVDAPPEAPEPQAAARAAAVPSAKQPWTIKNLAVSGGRIEITAFGEPGLMLPFTFATSAQDIDLNRLDQLSLQNAIKIARQDLDYPRYGVKLTDLSGLIFFSLPPGSKTANNLNQTIHIGKAEWKELALTEVWSSVTFDRTGIYGNVDAKSYGGYVTGDYYVRFDGGFPWHAGLYITDAGVKEPVAKLAGKSFSLDGRMNGSLEVDAKSREIERTEGRVSFPDGGRMEIASVDNLAQKLPAAWEPWKKKIVDNVLDGFRDYRFDTGTLFMKYGTPTSHAQLTLEGNQGRRNFEVNWTRENAQANFTLPAKTPPRIQIQAQPAKP